MPTLDDWSNQVAIADTSASNGNTAFAQQYSKELRSAVSRYAARLPRTLQRHLGPSEVGHPCDRQVVGKMAGVSFGTASGNHLHDPWASFVGTAIHAMLEDVFKWDTAAPDPAKSDSENGLHPGRWEPERRVTPDPQAASPHPGTADLYDWKHRAVVDHKCQSEGVRDKLKRSGPPAHYFFQMMLYAFGYMWEGFKVERVVLVSWPRTKSSMDDIYVYEHVITDQDIKDTLALLEKTEVREKLAALIINGELNLFDIPATPSDDDCQYCFSGDTEVVTRQGIKPLSELAGTEAELLVPTVTGTTRKGRGSFQPVKVLEFGTQELMKVTLRRNRAEKIVYATPEHRWLTSFKKSGRPEKQEIVTTENLVQGTALKGLQASKADREKSMMPVAVAQGFTFGDGTLTSDPERPASVMIYANHKDSALLPFFPGTHKEGTSPQPHVRVDNLPRLWKFLPPIDESRNFLMSWLAGYFAADGHVTKRGQCAISSANRGHLEFVRSVCAVLGVGYSQVNTKLRLGIRQEEESELHTLNLIRSDLPSWFFITAEHARRAESANENSRPENNRWQVISVERTDRFETVYCAVVPEVEAFGLSDDLMTMNCPFFNPRAGIDPAATGCPGTAAAKS